MAVALLLAVTVLVSSAPGRSALAHVPKLSSSKILVGPETVDVQVLVHAVDLELVLDVRLHNPETGDVDPELLAQAATLTTAYVAEGAAVFTQEGRRCEPVAEPPEASGDKVMWSIAWRCPLVHGGLVYRVVLFHEHAAAARHMVVFGADGEKGLALLSANATEISLAPGQTSLGRVFGSYLLAGIEHIFLGFDHIAFLVGVILWGRRLRPLVLAVTAFTLGHSITLSLAALDIASIPSTIVEPLIAASIVYVGIENFFVRGIERRWRLTAPFGLIHGFGFAGALREFGIPHDAVVPALAAFNLGVEIGQLGIVLIAVSVLLLIDHLFPKTEAGYARRPQVAYACTSAVLLLGLYWLLERTLLA